MSFIKGLRVSNSFDSLLNSPLSKWNEESYLLGLLTDWDIDCHQFSNQVMCDFCERTSKVEELLLLGLHKVSSLLISKPNDSLLSLFDIPKSAESQLPPSSMQAVYLHILTQTLRLWYKDKPVSASFLNSEQLWNSLKHLHSMSNMIGLPISESSRTSLQINTSTQLQPGTQRNPLSGRVEVIKDRNLLKCSCQQICNQPDISERLCRLSTSSVLSPPITVDENFLQLSDCVRWFWISLCISGCLNCYPDISSRPFVAYCLRLLANSEPVSRAVVFSSLLLSVKDDDNQDLLPVIMQETIQRFPTQQLSLIDVIYPSYIRLASQTISKCIQLPAQYSASSHALRFILLESIQSEGLSSHNLQQLQCCLDVILTATETIPLSILPSLDMIAQIYARVQIRSGQPQDMRAWLRTPAIQQYYDLFLS